MSRDTEVKIKAGLDSYTFMTGNRNLSEAFNLTPGHSIVFKGGDAVSFLNGNIKWRDNVSQRDRKIVDLITEPQRANYSERLQYMISGMDDRPTEEKWRDIEQNTTLIVEIFYAG